MCLLAALPALGLGTTAATAAGATAAATTAGAATSASMLQTIGLVTSIGGSLAQGIAGANAANYQAALIEQQAQTEAELTAIEDERTRAEFNKAMRQQVAELAARGIQIDSPTALLLGREAASEMSFASQEVRARGQATQRELTAEQQVLEARATQSLLTGSVSAAGAFLDGGPEVWPELFA